MTQNQLTDLGIYLAIESELSKTVNFDHVIDVFVHQKPENHTSLNLFIEVIYIRVFLE